MYGSFLRDKKGKKSFSAVLLLRPADSLKLPVVAAAAVVAARLFFTFLPPTQNE